MALPCPSKIHTHIHQRPQLSNYFFQWKHVQPEIILLMVRWYCRYALSYRDVEEMMAEWGLSVDHSTIHRWVLQYGPELDQRCRPHLRPTTDSWRVDETYIRVKGAWTYLYRAVDFSGQTLESMLSAKRDTKAAKRFFKKVMKAWHTQVPRVINVDKYAAYTPAVDELKQEEGLREDTELRPTKYLNNRVEQDHHWIKRLGNQDWALAHSIRLDGRCKATKRWR